MATDTQKKKEKKIGVEGKEEPHQMTASQKHKKNELGSVNKKPGKSLS